jgi:hypothetical protein
MSWIISPDDPTISPATKAATVKDICVVLEVRGPTTMADLTAALAQIDGVVAARTGPPVDGSGED